MAKRIDKTWSIPTVEYYAALKRKEALIPSVVVWMSLEHIMLREIRQTQKDRYCMISLT